MGRVREEKRTEEKKKEERRKRRKKKEERRKKKEDRRKKKEERRKKEEGRRKKEEERRKEKEEKTRKSPKQEDPGAQKGWKFATNCVFPMICGSGGSKSRLAKAAGAEPSGQMRDEKLHAVMARNTFPSQNTKHAMLKKCTRLWHEAHFQVKMYKTPSCSDHSWKLRCPMHTVVVQSTFRGQTVQNTSYSDHFWKLRC